MFLLDTMVLSERGKRNANPQVIEWIDGIGADHIWTSVVAFGEIASGIAKKRKSDPSFAQKLTLWSARTQHEFLDRTLPVTTAIALRWGQLCADLNRRDTDLLIAATALEHGLTVATRNVRHFEPTGAKLFNPYEA